MSAPVVRRAARALRPLSLPRRLWTDCEGGAMVEFVLVLPLLLTLFFGLLLWGESLFIQQQVSWASAELARTAGVGEAPDDREALFDALAGQVLQTFFFPACAEAAFAESAERVTVTVTYDMARAETCRFVPALPFVPAPSAFESQREILVSVP
ncbi:hypothetical protein AY600_20080 [Phormidium willei BDU 130791]|nr:hypothetical protein AY600_20080 [Phormidium willei BDU 130791]